MDERRMALQEAIAAMRRMGLAITDEQAAELLKNAEQVPCPGGVKSEDYVELANRIRKL